MLSFRAGLVLIFSATLAVSPALASRTTHKATSSAHKAPASGRGRSSRSSRKPGAKASQSHKLHGQQAIDGARVTEIQQALIREHYLSGDPSGSWDASTQAAMLKYQGDQGWQTRLLPDSRALKKLGLGPDYSSAINAEGSSFVAPAPANTIPAEQASGFAAAAGIKQ